jgi:hypothetical protein
MNSSWKRIEITSHLWQGFSKGFFQYIYIYIYIYIYMGPGGPRGPAGLRGGPGAPVIYIYIYIYITVFSNIFCCVCSDFSNVFWQCFVFIVFCEKTINTVFSIVLLLFAQFFQVFSDRYSIARRSRKPCSPVASCQHKQQQLYIYIYIYHYIA